MEPEMVRVERRGRKRKRKDVQTVGTDGDLTRGVVATRSKALVGSYVNKEFEGSGVFLGKVVHYEKGLYRIEYEDGDCEDLESGELRPILIRNDNFEDGLLTKKKELDDLISKKYERERSKRMRDAVELANADALHGVDASTSGDINNFGKNDTNGDIADDHSASDSGEYAHNDDFIVEAEASIIPPPELPPSTGNIGVPDECVADLLSVYGFLRSFSIPLFLSPFGLEDFVGCLNCFAQNTLLDAIHVALMRVLRRHFEALSSDGSELASKCLRSMDWSLIDSLTWPVFVVQYMMMMGYSEGLKWKGFYVEALQRDYYSLSVSRKLMILQILCDDALDSAELRAEIDMREESEVEVEVEHDGDTVATPDVGPRRVHPRYSKTSAYKNQEATEVNKERHETKSSSLDQKSTKPDAGADADKDKNSDECRLCGMDGTLVCCDGCPSAYHLRCIGLSKLSVPDGDWYCPECTFDKNSPTITRGTSLHGADFLGVDPYGQVFLGTCDHLLVIKVSMNSDPCARYYNQKDISAVLLALCSKSEHVTMYLGLCERIMQYWEIPADIISVGKNVEMGTQLAAEIKHGAHACPTTQLSLLDTDIHEISLNRKIASCSDGNISENIAAPLPQTTTGEPESSKTSMVMLAQPDHPVRQPNDCGSTASLSENINVPGTPTFGSIRQQAEPSETTHLKLVGRSSIVLHDTCTSGSNSSDTGQSNATCVTAKKLPQGVVKFHVSGRGCKDITNSCFYLGSSFKAQTYTNQYIHGDFAAAAAANLSIISSEENHVSESNISNNYRKVMSANISLQIKAFSSVALRFFWPNSEKKLVEVPRERCGFCLSCKGICHNKRGCLLNAAASNAIRGTMKVLAGIRPVKNGEGSLQGIATYVLFMEESLRGLTVGPFKNSTYRNKWCKQAEHASSCSAIKSLLLELEENIRAVAFSGDWVKLVDGWSVDSATHGINAAGSSQKRPSGRRGRKPSAMPEVTADEEQDILDDFIWWRGGMLSKFIYQKGILPSTMVKRSARQGGSRKIPGIYYVEGIEVPKRSKRFIWRAALEMSKNVSQVATQIRYLDIHVRWNDLVRPEQSPLDGKGAETEAYVFRNGFICDKQILENKVRYAVAFGKQKHLPSRIMKTVTEVEKSEDGTEKYWFLETRIPLYLIKEYEEKRDKVPSPVTEKPVNVLSELQRRQLKVARTDIFSYLARRRDNLDTCRCASCQLDVFLGNAVKCSKCEGYCHFQCTVSSTVHMNVEVEFVITCKSCYQAEAVVHNAKYNVSPTSPLLSQRREPHNSSLIFKGEKQNGFSRPLVSNGTLSRTSEKKPNGSSLKPKKGNKLCSWGLIWKKKETGTDGTDFRLKNILPKGNSNGSSVECDLCKQPYNPDLMYICCETCTKWYHADAVELEESRILDLAGFKCCKCRRIRSPLCPYTDPERKSALEVKKSSRRAPKQENLVTDSSAIPISEQLTQREPAIPVLPTKKELVCIKGENPLTFSLARVEHATQQSSEVASEQNPILSSSVPQKLPVRRHVKREDDFVGPLTNNASGDPSTPITGNAFANAEESSTCLEWDVSTNNFEGDFMFDTEGLNYEDMEFEPQTYFSFNELLAFDDGAQLDGVDSSTGLNDNIENSVIPADGNFEQYEMIMNQQEHIDSLDVVPCRICFHTEPIPDRCCEVCGMWMHNYCSQWVEESSNNGAWRCGNCRNWQ